MKFTIEEIQKKQPEVLNEILHLFAENVSKRIHKYHLPVN
jgi:hypothetical protein